MVEEADANNPVMRPLAVQFAPNKAAGDKLHHERFAFIVERAAFLWRGYALKAHRDPLNLDGVSIADVGNGSG